MSDSSVTNEMLLATFRQSGKDEAIKLVLSLYDANIENIPKKDYIIRSLEKLLKTHVNLNRSRKRNPETYENWAKQNYSKPISTQLVDSEAASRF